MTLYYETSVKFKEEGAITTNGIWHNTYPLLAVASYSQERGGFISIFDDLGEMLPDIEPPWHPVAQVTALTWHPEKTLLVVGWEDGALRTWDNTLQGFNTVSAPHSAPLILLGFSEKGSRLVSADSTGSLVVWKIDSRNQLFTTFHHNIKESITHLAFRKCVQSKVQQEIENLAKAAVNGDEQALDLLSNWRPRTAAHKVSMHTNTTDNQCFYIGTQSGIVYYINQVGNCVEVMNTDGQSLANILYHPSRDTMVIMTEGLNVNYFTVDADGHLNEIAKVKMSGNLQSYSGANSQGLIWAGPSLLAILTGDIRIWNVDNNDNYLLPKTQNSTAENETASSTVIFTSISYCKLNNILCAGTNLGQIYFWSYTDLNNEKYIENPEDAWVLKNVNQINGTVKQLLWGSVNLLNPLLAVNCITKVYILKEQSLNTCYSESVWAVQLNAFEILLKYESGSIFLKTDVQISSISMNKDVICVSNGKSIMIYDIIWEENTDNSEIKKYIKIKTNLMSTFQCDNETISLCGKKIIALTSLGINIHSLNGLLIASINSITIEGEAIGIDVNKHYLTIFTMNGFIKVFDVSSDEPKIMIPSKNIYELCLDFGEVICARTNCDGTKVAFTIASANLIPNQVLYLLDIENDFLQEFNFNDTDTKQMNIKGIETSIIQTDEDNDLNSHNKKMCMNRIPVNFFWDNEDERLLVCSAKKFKNESFVENNSTFKKYKGGTSKEKMNVDHIIITMFVSSEHNIMIKDIVPYNSETQLIAFCCPYTVVLENGNVIRNLMSDFNGLEKYSQNTKKALMDFSYNLSLGNVDAAIQSIRLLPDSGNAWRSLARVCVSTCRVDVAKVCLGHIGAAREVKALRVAMEQLKEPEAVVAMLAVQLGMLDEAEELYKQCNRYDLLNRLYQARNKFSEASDVAMRFDRIHKRATAHAWAKSLEIAGDIPIAIQRYEIAGCHQQNVPRMLLNQPHDLEEYIKKNGDKDLLKWWGQYLESTGDMIRALAAYEAAKDFFSQVRVLCFSQQVERAAQIARTSGDRAAAYHMARYYETNEDIDNAVLFFTKAQAYNNAIRLCKEHVLNEELWNIAMVAGKRDKMECAKYFEKLFEMDKAILLYHQSGMVHKAVDLAFKSKQYDTLQSISTDLDTDSDPVLIQKCADYFVENHHFEKAVDLLAAGKKFIEALDICLKHNVQVTEALAERLTPEKDQLDEEMRIFVLIKLAESLQTQGNYHLATKKFTQAGDKIRAMKSLLKSGDTEKIIFFANVSRQKEIYVMAANYLQSLDWQNQPVVLRNIINFYLKGKAHDLLANFYVACAQVEIDEFQNYEKALGALTEANRALSKVTAPRDITQHKKATDRIINEMAAIQSFIDVKKIFEHGDISAGVTQARQLIGSNDPNIQTYVRKGDIYAIMIQYMLSSGNISEVKQLIIELRQHLIESGNVSLTYYLSGELIQALSKNLGIPISALVPQEAKVEIDDTEPEIAEEVEYE